MKLECFCVQDRLAGFSFPPFFTRSSAEAERMFVQLMADPARTGAVSDYCLYHVGSFDDRSMSIESLEMPDFIRSGSETHVK